jgi:hypothetical protein
MRLIRYCPLRTADEVTRLRAAARRLVKQGALAVTAALSLSIDSLPESTLSIRR